MYGIGNLSSWLILKEFCRMVFFGQTGDTCSSKLILLVPGQLDVGSGFSLKTRVGSESGRWKEGQEEGRTSSSVSLT